MPKAFPKQFREDVIRVDKDSQNFTARAMTSALGAKSGDFRPTSPGDVRRPSSRTP
jgi:hypothetical protein